MFKLPDFDTGQYEGYELLMKDGGTTLIIFIEELNSVRIVFKNVRWYQYTDVHHCSVEMIDDAYFKLIEVIDSKEMCSFLEKIGGDGRRPYKEIHHYRIFLDGTGCHEFLAESANL